MKTDTSRMMTGEDIMAARGHEIYFLEGARRARFAVQLLPGCYRPVVRTEDKKRDLGVVRSPGEAGIVMVMPGTPGLFVVIGISRKDAEARVARLNLPGRPDGLHMWN